MTRDVLARKLAHLERYLVDLEPHGGEPPERIQDRPYEVERLLELLVQVAMDIVAHDLGQQGIVPSSYRQAFLRAGEVGLLPEELAGRLADAAGLRNVLVHLYEDIDYQIVAQSVDRALEDFRQLHRIYVERLDDYPE